MQSALIEKLHLPFPLLSDRDRSEAIEPYGVADPKDERNIAVPATVVIGTDGEEKFRTVGRDFADRPMDEEVIEAVRALDLPPTQQEPPRTANAEAGPAAFKVEQMVPYYRGARFAAIAMGRRFPEAKDDAYRYTQMLDRYMESATALFKAKKQAGEI